MYTITYSIFNAYFTLYGMQLQQSYLHIKVVPTIFRRKYIILLIYEMYLIPTPCRFWKLFRNH